MMAMILVNEQGNDDCVIWPLKESAWNGLSTADCIFPSFLFIIGMAVPFSLKPEDKYKLKIWLRIIYRSCALFAIGVLLHIEGRSYINYRNGKFTFRIMGVLERSGLCYFILSSVFLLIP